MNIKLIVTDLDNTLLKNNKTISPYSAEIFKKCKEYGIKTSVATARYITGISGFSKQILPDYQITNDGTMTFNNGNFLFGFYLELNQANDILDTIKNENPGSYISVVNDNGIYRQPGADTVLNPASAESPSFMHRFTRPLTIPPFKIVMECNEPALANDIAKAFNCRLVKYRNENRYAFISQMAGKVNAIKELTKMLSISLNDVAAFGDDMNDYDMMCQCGLSIAVSNAINEIKNISDYITDSNENDGVAKFIEHHFLS